MPSIETDDNQDRRIDTDILVDAYYEEEQALGWYYYLDRHLNCPFKAKWITTGSRSTPEKWEPVEASASLQKKIA